MTDYLSPRAAVPPTARKPRPVNTIQGSILDPAVARQNDDYRASLKRERDEAKELRNLERDVQNANMQIMVLTMDVKAKDERMRQLEGEIARIKMEHQMQLIMMGSRSGFAPMGVGMSLGENSGMIGGMGGLGGFSGIGGFGGFFPNTVRSSLTVCDQRRKVLTFLMFSCLKQVNGHAGGSGFAAAPANLGLNVDHAAGTQNGAEI